MVGWDKKANRYDLHPIVRGVVWQALDGQSRKGIYADLHTYFDAVPKPPDWQKVESLADLTPAIELCQSLIGLERFEDAISVFRQHVGKATLYRLSASRLRVELLERFFPDGVDNPPRLTQPTSQSYALNALALAYDKSGEPDRAAPLFRRKLRINEREKDFGRLVQGLRNLVETLVPIGHFREAAIEAYRSVEISRSKLHPIQESRSLRVAGVVLVCLGDFAQSLVTFRRALGMITSSRERRRDQGVTFCDLSQRHLWLEEPAEALLLAEKALKLALPYERDSIRAVRLRGTALFEVNAPTAAECLQHALTRARAVSHVEEELPTLTALAELHRRKNEPATARELLNQVWVAAERGPYPLFHADALNVLAQIERDQGNRDAAITAATKAYTLAWCDGISADGKVCYAYHYGLTNARKHLQALGAPEPQLPPFDESKFPPLPNVELNPKDEFWVDPTSLDSNP